MSRTHSSKWRKQYFLAIMSSAGVVLVGVGRRITVGDVVNVAVFNHVVSVEAARGISGGSTAASSPVRARNRQQSVLCSRAAVFCRVVSLILSPTSNPTLIKYLIDILNSSIVPVVTTESDLGSFLEGRGCCMDLLGCSLDNLACLDTLHISRSIFSNSEINELVGFPFVSISLGCLAAAASSNLLSVVDSVAALSCEAYGCYSEPFDSAYFELNKPHRGLLLTAHNLRLLLEGSKRMNSCNSDTMVLAAGLHSTPQVVGPCRDAIASSIKAMEIELNSFENNVANRQCGVQFDSSPSVLVTDGLSIALDRLVKASLDRHKAISNVLSTVHPAKEDNASSVLSNVDRLAAHLREELTTAQRILLSLEEQAAALNSSRPAAPEDGARSEQGPPEGRGKTKPEPDESGWTPEQRAKAEAKRKEKADKAAQKAAEKALKKATAGSVAVVLGVGTTNIRAFISRRCRDASSPLVLSDSAVLRDIVDPFDFQEGSSFSSFCSKLIEQLSSGGKYKPKIAKGARDFGPKQMHIREQVFSSIRRVFKRHGGVEIDTPVFELKELLTGKYGEDSKLIYDLADQGGELLSLRYDLTVPFARFLAMNSVGNIKRFHIAKVYRRDQPQPQRGRYREFYQCDFDVAGSYSPMVADAEVITVATEILSDLPVGRFCIKLNHRKLLDAIFELCGVPADKFRPLCSAVDKLDKMPWSEVKQEMVEEKGLSSEAADRIGEFVLHSGQPKELLCTFRQRALFGTHAAANQALNDLQLLFDYLDAMGSLQHVSFDLSLARGLDYYTGVIYEAILLDGSSSSVGSIAAGGRYDNLVGMFSPSGVQTPCVGVSIGVERVFAILERKADESTTLQSTTIQVFIASIGPNMITERMKIAQSLWAANISAEYAHQDNPKLKKQLDEVLERGIPYMVVFGQDELQMGRVKLKDMRQHTEEEVALDDLVSLLGRSGCSTCGSEDMQLLDSLRACVV